MIGRFYRLPFRLVEPEGHEAAMIVDADGNSVAMMMWAGHTLEDEEAATEETYAVGRLFAASVDALPKGGDAKQGSVRSKGSAVPKADAHAPSGEVQ